MSRTQAWSSPSPATSFAPGLCSREIVQSQPESNYPKVFLAIYHHFRDSDIIVNIVFKIKIKIVL